MKNPLMLLVLALTLGACDILGSRNELQFTLSIREIDEIDFDNPKRAARTELARIVVEGELWTNCRENVPAGDVVLAGRNQIRVVITERKAEPGCTPTVSLYDFVAVIGPLEAGLYQVSIIYQDLGVPARTVLEQSLDVR
jgi:hypothetical protein